MEQILIGTHIENVSTKACLPHNDMGVYRSNTFFLIIAFLCIAKQSNDKSEMWNMSKAKYLAIHMCNDNFVTWEEI